MALERFYLHVGCECPIIGCPGRIDEEWAGHKHLHCDAPNPHNFERDDGLTFREGEPTYVRA